MPILKEKWWNLFNESQPRHGSAAANFMKPDMVACGKISL
jgi:hypothetical protein